MQCVPAEHVPIPYGLTSTTRVRTGIREDAGDEQCWGDHALNALKLLEFMDAESIRQATKKATFTAGGSSVGEDEYEDREYVQVKWLSAVGLPRYEVMR